MLKKPYDVRAFIEAYVATQRQDFPHDDFTRYYQALFERLQELFGIRLSHEVFREARNRNEAGAFERLMFWLDFKDTVQSLLAIRTPWSNYLEVGLLVKKLQQAGSCGETALRLEDEISSLASRNRELHYERLYHLLICMYGPVEVVITSEQLKERGFDDSTEPKIWDYLE